MARKFDDEFDVPHVVEEPEKEELLLGSIFRLDDKKVWGFALESGDWHPGACYEVDGNTRQANLSKGTSRHPGRRASAYVEVQPTRENGLEKITYFQLSVCRLRMQRLELMIHDRKMGKLSTADLEAIRDGMREFGLEGTGNE